MKATKNTNEFFIGNRLYVKEIKKCECSERNGNEFLLDCKIHERGEKKYSYDPDYDYIYVGYKHKSLDDPIQRLWLTDSAKETVKKAVNDFELKVDALMEGSDIIDISELNYTISFNDNEALFKLKNRCEICSYLTIENLLRETVSYRLFDRNISDEGEEILDIIRHSDKVTLLRNPLYLYAINSGKEQLGLEIKLYYNLADENDCRILSEYYGERILPPLPKQFDEYFAVDRGSVDFELLNRSGYTILHRPYFGMIDCTHSKIQLNPHTKQGIDAAEKESESISFEEYLEIFDTKNIGKLNDESQGVFWIVEGELFAFPYRDGVYAKGVALSGNTYNHKKLWNEVKPDGCDKPYNYYPRGRVVITNKGSSIIYMSPYIDETYVIDIKNKFGLRTEPKINFDFSDNYNCYLDDGWEPD